MLAQRRLTEAQLRTRLARKGFGEEDVRSAVAACKTAGFIDDALFARLFVDGRTRAVGNARLVADLVRRGIDCGRRQKERTRLRAPGERTPRPRR